MSQLSSSSIRRPQVAHRRTLVTSLSRIIVLDAGAKKLPASIKTSNLIRNLSVLVSQLEHVSGPSETNRVFCLKSSKAISLKLDRILDNSTAINFAKSSNRPEPVPAPHMLDNISLDAMPDTESNGFVHFEHFDLAD